jgi:hypothetical protein
VRLRSIRGVSVLVMAVAAAIQFVRPARTNPAIEPGRTLTGSTAVPEEVAEVLDRACRDCHSNATRWPWYSNVAPVSWFVLDHVNHGRSHLNFSEWTRYTPSEADKLMTNVCDLVQKGDMPLRSYTWMHRSARLGSREVEALCAWVLTER